MAEETRIVTKFLHERPDDSWTIDAALGNGAYDGLRKALGHDARGDRRRGHDVGAARSRRRRVRHRPEVVVPAQGRVPALPRGERRRR